MPIRILSTLSGSTPLAFGVGIAIAIGAAACVDPPATQPEAPPAIQRGAPPAMRPGAASSIEADRPADEQPSTPDDLPEAKELVERAITSMGGRDAFEAIESWHTSMQMDSELGKIVVDLYQHGDDQLLVETQIPGFGSLIMARNGQTGWSRSPLGDYQLLTDQQMATIGDQHYHTLLLDLEEKYNEIRTEGRERFADHDAWKVRISGRKEGTHTERKRVKFLFFDVETGMILGMQQGRTGAAGASRKHFEDWRYFDELELFTRIIDAQGRGVTQEYTDVTFDEVDEDVFTVPPPVERLLEDKHKNSKAGPPAPPSPDARSGER